MDCWASAGDSGGRGMKGGEGGRILQLVALAGRPGESTAGWMGGGSRAGGGSVGRERREREGGDSCQCISIFTLQPRWLSHPVHPSTIPPSRSPPRVSLFPRQPPPMFPWRRSPSLLHPNPHNLNRQCSDYHCVAATRGAWLGEGAEVMWMVETERARRRRMKANGNERDGGGGQKKAKARRDEEGVSKGDWESRRREIKIREDEGHWMKVTVMEEITG